MGTKNIINIPEGYEIDKEQSTDRQIVLKKIALKKSVLKKIERPRTWEEYCLMMKGKQSFYCNSETNYSTVQSKFDDRPCIDEFDNKEDAKAFLALSRLRKLRKAWIFDWKPDWASQDQKFVITTFKNNIEENINYNASRSLSFPTEDMCNEFHKTFKDLLEIAKPLL